MKNIIKEQRNILDMSVTTLSKLIGTTEEEILLWECGKKEPAIPEIIRLSQVFQIEIDDLVSELAKQKTNDFVLPVSEVKFRDVLENKPSDENKVSPLSKSKGNKDIYNSKIGIDKLGKYTSIALLSSVLFFILFSGVNSQSELNNRNNPFEEEALEFIYAVVGINVGDEVIVGPLAYNSYDSERKMILFSNPDATEGEIYLELGEMETYIGRLDDKEFKKWSAFTGRKLVYVKGILYHFINGHAFYIEASEIKFAE